MREAETIPFEVPAAEGRAYPARLSSSGIRTGRSRWVQEPVALERRAGLTYRKFKVSFLPDFDTLKGRDPVPIAASAPKADHS